MSVARSCRGLFCGSCPPGDARCTLAACRTFHGCGGLLPAEPRARVCPSAADAGIDLAEYCPEACIAMSAGAAVEQGCAADGGAVQADAGALLPDGGDCDCTARRATCEQACPQTAARDCLDCAANCAIDFTRCRAGCR
jgi:hypothetical protein